MRVQSGDSPSSRVGLTLLKHPQLETRYLKHQITDGSCHSKSPPN